MTTLTTVRLNLHSIYVCVSNYLQLFCAVIARPVYTRLATTNRSRVSMCLGLTIWVSQIFCLWRPDL